MTSSLTPQEEIQRLNSIISILLEQVAVLKRENATLKSNDGTNNKFYTNEVFAEGAKTKFYTSEEDKGGVNNKIYTSDVFTEGIKTKFNTSEEATGGINNKFYTGEKVTDGIKTIKDASANEKPTVIESSDENVTKLSGELKDTMPDGTTRQTRKTVARELLFLYNNGFANGHELRKAANLSLSGFSKHFPLLKRRNFIYKHGVKKYALTPFAWGIINNTFGTP